MGFQQCKAFKLLSFDIDSTLIFSVSLLLSFLCQISLPFVLSIFSRIRLSDWKNLLFLNNFMNEIQQASLIFDFFILFIFQVSCCSNYRCNTNNRFEGKLPVRLGIFFICLNKKFHRI